MAFKLKHQVELDTEGDEQDVAEELSSKSAAVISGNDWTTETIVIQVAKETFGLRLGFSAAMHGRLIEKADLSNP